MTTPNNAQIDAIENTFSVIAPIIRYRDDEDNDLEYPAFFIANNMDVPKDIRDAVGALWGAYCDLGTAAVTVLDWLNVATNDQVMKLEARTSLSVRERDAALASIQRYELQMYLQEDSDITPDDEGSYVKYDDHLIAIAAKDTEITTLCEELCRVITARMVLKADKVMCVFSKDGKTISDIHELSVDLYNRRAEALLKAEESKP